MRKIHFLMLSTVMLSTVAVAQIPTTDAAAIAQMLNQIKQTAVVIEQTTSAAKSLQDTLSGNLNIDQAKAINDILSKVRQANAVGAGASGMQQQFDENFAGDATFEKSHVARTASTRQAAISNAATLDALPADAGRLNRLVDQSNSAAGALQAQQAGNQINAELVGQMMALRQQLALQAQAQNAEAGMRAREEKAQADITREFFGGKMK